MQFRAQVPESEQVKIVRAAGGRSATPVPLIHAIAARLSARAAVRLARDHSVRAVSRNGRVAPQASQIDASALASAHAPARYEE